MRFAEPSPILESPQGIPRTARKIVAGHNRATVDKDQKSRGRGSASDELSPIVRGARESHSPNRARACGSGCDYGAGARYSGDSPVDLRLLAGTAVMAVSPPQFGAHLLALSLLLL